MKRIGIYLTTVLISLMLVRCTQQEEVALPTVGIQPLGDFDQEQLDAIKSGIEETYGFTVHFLIQRELPDWTFINVKTPRYRADKLLRYLHDVKPDSIDYILGVTRDDISTTKFDEHGEIKKPEYKYEDWGVFGFGNRPGAAGVISSHRLNNDPDKMDSRLIKVAIHELGHNLGLRHCESGENCVMQNAAKTMEAMDTVISEPCNICWSEIGGKPNRSK